MTTLNDKQIVVGSANEMSGYLLKNSLNFPPNSWGRILGLGLAFGMLKSGFPFVFCFASRRRFVMQLSKDDRIRLAPFSKAEDLVPVGGKKARPDPMSMTP